MSIEKGVYSRLTADSTLAPIVSTTDSPALVKVFAARIDQEVAPPFVRFWRVGVRRPDTLDGHNGSVRATVQVDCFSKTYGEMKSMLDAVRLSLDGFKGTAGTEEVKGSRMISERDFFDEEAELFVGSADFNIWYIETTS